MNTRLSLICLLAFVTALIGCKKVEEKAIEQSIERSAKQEGRDVKVDVDTQKEGSISIKSEEAGKTTTATIDGDKVTVKSENMSYTGEKGSVQMHGPDGSVSITSGESAKLPDNFPKDIPVYAGSQVVMGMTMTENEAFSIELNTSDSMDKVAEYYKKEMPANGWQAGETVTQPGGSPMQMYMFKKEGREVVVMLTLVDGKAHIAINVSKP